MSQFSENPAVYEEVPYSADLVDDIAAALSEEYGTPETAEEQTPDGENYPDDEPEEELEEDEDSDEDAADEEVQSVVDDLQKQADACGKFLAAKGIDYNALRDEYLENGKLSKANLKSLADAGIDEELINGYIEGQQARFKVYSQHVMDIAGGAEEYDKLLRWAGKNLSEKEIKHFNKAVDSNDVDEARFAVKGLMAMREKAQGGRRPKLVHGKTSRPAPSVKGFRSLAEQAKAMDDPRYEVDPEYTRKVDRRILASGY